MIYVYIVMIVALLPFILLLWSAIDVGAGKKERINWKLPFLLFIITFGASIYANYALKQAYQFPIFPNWSDLQMGLFVIAVLAGAFSLVYVITYFSFRRAPKAVFNQARTLQMLGGILLLAILLVGWYHPTAEKMMVAAAITTANEIDDEEEKELSLILVHSERECSLTYSFQCRDQDYKNLFIVKNKMDQQVEVQFKIRAYGSEQQELKQIDSDIMTLAPHEIKVVTTAETFEETSVWSQRTFRTRSPVSSYEYRYRYQSL